MLSRAGARQGVKYSLQFMCPLVNTFFGRHEPESSGHLLQTTEQHAVGTAFCWSWRQSNRIAHSCIRSYSQQQTKEHILAAEEDKYDGVIIDAEQLPTNREQFAQRLDSSLKEWTRKGKRGVWMTLKLTHAGLLEAAISAGFDFHLAKKGALVLTKWLPSNMLDRLPEGPTHQVGVGAFVLNEQREVLLVQESFGILRGQGIWKLPTGLSNLGEDVPEAAVREVREETGIRTTFDRVLAIRQSHSQSLGRSDLFFVCALTLDSGPQNIVLQPEELAAADWHPLEAAEQMPIFQSGPMFRAIFAQCKAYALGSYQGMGAWKLDNGFNPDSDLLLHA